MVMTQVPSSVFSIAPTMSNAAGVEVLKLVVKDGGKKTDFRKELSHRWTLMPVSNGYH